MKGDKFDDADSIFEQLLEADVDVEDVELLNTYQVVNYNKLIMTKATIKQLEEAFK